MRSPSRALSLSLSFTPASNQCDNSLSLSLSNNLALAEGCIHTRARRGGQASKIESIYTGRRGRSSLPTSPTLYLKKEIVAREHTHTRTYIRILRRARAHCSMCKCHGPSRAAGGQLTRATPDPPLCSSPAAAATAPCVLLPLTFDGGG